MSLTLTTVASNGGPLSSGQNDANMDAIMTEVNATEANVSSLQTAVAATVTQTELNDAFAGVSAGKQQIAWANVLNPPPVAPVYPFRVTVTGSDQQLVVTDSVPFTATVTLNSIDFDPASAVNAAASTWTAPVAGYYMLNAATQIYLASGTPTTISMYLNIMKNGTSVVSATIDLNNNTGNRIWRINDLISLNLGDVVTLQVAISETGDATWAIAANENSNLNGFLVFQTS